MNAAGTENYFQDGNEAHWDEFWEAAEPRFNETIGERATARLECLMRHAFDAGYMAGGAVCTTHLQERFNEIIAKRAAEGGREMP